MISITFSSCGLIFGSSGKVDQKNSNYNIRRLDRKNKDWQRIETGGKSKNESYSAGEQDPDRADIAFEHKPTSAITSLNSVCKPQKDIALALLAKNLFMGLPEFKTIFSNEIQVDGVQAIDTLVETIQTKDAMRIRAIVLKKLGCTFDLMLIVKASHYDLTLPDFESFVKEFHVD